MHARESSLSLTKRPLTREEKSFPNLEPHSTTPSGRLCNVHFNTSVTYIADILQYQLWDDWGLRPISYSGLTAVGKTNALMDRSSMISEIVAGDSAWECGDQLKTKNMAFTRSRSGDREYGHF